jgi:hypothetical protein
MSIPLEDVKSIVLRVEWFDSELEKLVLAVVSNDEPATK